MRSTDQSRATTPTRSTPPRKPPARRIPTPVSVEVPLRKQRGFVGSDLSLLAAGFDLIDQALDGVYFV